MENQGNLLRNCVLFAQLLRALGVDVTPTQIVDLVESLKYVQIGNRQDFQNSARALLINRREHLPIFDEAFDLFWRARKPGQLVEMDMGTLLRKEENLQIEKSRSGSEGDGDEPEDEDPYVETIYTYSNREILRQKDFSTLDEEELAALRRLMLQMTWKLELRRTRRTTSATHGNFLDMRRTFRHNMRHGGELLKLAHKQRKTKPRPLVVICDISGSMERYSRVLLQFIYAVSNPVERGGTDSVEAFVFSTRLTRITRQLRTKDVDQALTDAAGMVHDWAGGTRIGESLKTFNYDWGRRVLGQGAILLIISDGWDRGDIDLLTREMDRLHRSCHRLIWLNPLLGSADYQPLVRGIQAAMPHIDDFLPVHNLESLEQLAKMLGDV